MESTCAFHDRSSRRLGPIFFSFFYSTLLSLSHAQKRIKRKKGHATCQTTKEGNNNNNNKKRKKKKKSIDIGRRRKRTYLRVCIIKAMKSQLGTPTILGSREFNEEEIIPTRVFTVVPSACRK